MSGMNIGQFINRFSNSELGKKFDITVQGANNQVTDIKIQPKGNFDMPSLYTPPQSSPLRQPPDERQLAIKLNGADKIILVKELLNIPKDIKDFLLMMTEQAQEPVQDMQKLMLTLLASNVDISKLVHLLQSNGKDAATKLFQMIANFNQMGNSVNTDELKQLTGLINAFVPSSQASQNQALKTLMLLYLPWLPLAENTGFQLEIGGSDEEKEKVSEDSISVLISTENFGNVKVLLYKVPGDSLEVQFSCSKDFPKEEVEDALKKETSEYKLKMQVGFEENKNIETDSIKEQKQQVSINAGQKVNSFLVLMAHFVVKTVLGIDKDYSLRQKRKEMI